MMHPWMILQIPFNIGVQCKVSARSLIAAPNYGVWYYNGYSTTSAGPFNMTPAVPLFPGYSSGDLLYGGESDFIFNTKGKTNGFYSITYDWELDSITLKVQIIDDDFCVAEDQIIVFSAATGSTDLTPYLDDVSCGAHKTGGTWVDLDSSGALTGSNFDPSAAGAGTWRIEYYYQETGFEETSCCDTSIILTCEVTGGFTASIGQSDVTCSFTLNVEHPGTATEGDVTFVLDTAVKRDYPVFDYKQKVTDSCTGTTISGTTRFVPNPATTSGVKMGVGDQPIQVGGWLETVRMYSVTTGTIDVPVAPSGVNQAVFSGSGGTTNATNLTYNGDKAKFTGAINRAIRNYLIDTVGLTENVDFYMGAINMESDNRLSIMMGIYHSAPNNWVGIQRATGQIVYKYDGVNTDTASDHVDFVTDAQLYYLYDQSPCPSIYYVSEPIAAATFYNTAAMDYNNFPLTAGTLSLTPDAGNTADCSGKTLTTSTVGCAGAVTYLWDSGEATAAVNKLVGSGLHTVTASCSSPVSSDEESVTL